MTRRSFLPPVAALATRAGLADHTIALPQPRTKGETSLEHCLLNRRSVRSYRDVPLLLDAVGQLLWAAQGVTAEGHLRTAPSAGALYPLEVYLVAGNVDGVSPGLYHYRPERHELLLVKPGDLRQELARATFEQDCVQSAAATILFAAVYARTGGKYGQRATRYVHMEAGHAAQNVCLQAAALGLGTVTVGAFQDDEVKRVAELPESHEPVYLMPVGRK
ncbi:MAG: SagB/ThcOx family dehydrogenase [Acidobacteriia bacterium]|nr:SagB/ThcOx family dehydrogenase [Terriglobia bacterium]